MSGHKVVQMLSVFLYVSILTGATALYAQNNKPKVDVPSAQIGQLAQLRADSVQYQALDTTKLKGKVVMVYYWSTKCAVCLDKMAELRTNVSGWRDKPFEIILINRDSKEQDYWDYLKVTQQLNLNNPQMTYVHAKELIVDNLYRAGTLPMVFLLDSSGVLKYRYVGRMPPLAWDQVADLLP